jgi:hypothetical protein
MALEGRLAACASLGTHRRRSCLKIDSMAVSERPSRGTLPRRLLGYITQSGSETPAEKKRES